MPVQMTPAELAHKFELEWRQAMHQAGALKRAIALSEGDKPHTKEQAYYHDRLLGKFQRNALRLGDLKHMASEKLGIPMEELGWEDRLFEAMQLFVAQCDTELRPWFPQTTLKLDEDKRKALIRQARNCMGKTYTS